MYTAGVVSIQCKTQSFILQVESVSLALQILDGSCVTASSTQRIEVERAQFQMKGEYNASLKPKKKRKKVLDKMQKKQEK